MRPIRNITAHALLRSDPLQTKAIVLDYSYSALTYIDLTWCTVKRSYMAALITINVPITNTQSHFHVDYPSPLRLQDLSVIAAIA
jgi:hypothetical protein